MKKVDLQYKMKNYQLAKNMNQTSKAKILNKIGLNDEFLESAEQFYKSQKPVSKRESNIVKPRNAQLQLKIRIKEGESGVDSSYQTKRTDCKITPDNLKRSVERDFNNNLEYWRKETFKYQQQVFTLERKNSQLTIENSKLKEQLKTKTQPSNQTKKLTLNPEKQQLELRQYQRNKLLQIQSQLKMKNVKLQQLSIVLKVISQKIRKTHPQLLNQLQIAPSLSFNHYISTLESKPPMSAHKQKEDLTFSSLSQPPLSQQVLTDNFLKKE